MAQALLAAWLLVRWGCGALASYLAGATQPDAPAGAQASPSPPPPCSSLLSYAKVTMGSIAEATRAKNALNGTYVDELCNPGEVLLIRFARISGAAYSSSYGSGPTSPSYASPRARPFGRAGSQAEAGHSPRAALTPTANGGPPARAASSLPTAHSGSSLASSAAGGGSSGGAGAAAAAQQCGSCGAAESATLALRRCSACKVGGCWGLDSELCSDGVHLL